MSVASFLGVDATTDGREICSIQIYENSSWSSIHHHPEMFGGAGAVAATMSAMAGPSSAFPSFGSHLSSSSSRTGSAGVSASGLPSVMEGRYTWEFRIDSTGQDGGGAALAIGVCSVDYAIDRSGGSPSPLGSDSASWCLFSSGERSHNNDRSQVFVSHWIQGDVIGMEIDMERGTITYFRNSETLGAVFQDLDKKYAGMEGGGVIPCVTLLARGARVSLHKKGLKTGAGSITYSSSDPLERKKWQGQWCRGKREGPAF